MLTNMVRTDSYDIDFILTGPERQSNKLPNLNVNDFTPEEINERFLLWGVDPGQINIFTASDGHDTDPHQLRKYSTAEYYTRTGFKKKKKKKFTKYLKKNRPVPIAPETIRRIKPRCFIHNAPEKWLPWEDELLQNYVKHNGKKWSEFVQHCLPTRSPGQCQARWTDILNPNLKRGPFSKSEKNLLEKGIAEFGEGQWSKISEGYLPQRSPRRIANEWTSVAKVTAGPWTKTEDELLIKGYEQFGSAWTKIANHYLPWRGRVQLRGHYQSKLNPNLSREKWSQDELDVLLRRTIMLGQDWKQVAEGLPGRSPLKCSLVWLNVLDPALNKGPWTDEETRLFWERVYHCQGNFVKVAEGLPGRNRVNCFHKFWTTVRKDREFEIIYGSLLEKGEEENDPAWRARIAKLVCEWLGHEIRVRISSNKSIRLHQIGPWNEQELLELKHLVEDQLKKKGALDNNDWKNIAENFPTRDARQCKYQYDEHLSVKEVKKGSWSKDEDELLLKLVNKHGIEDWDIILNHIPNRTKRQCSYRWHRVLKFKDADPPIIKNERLTDTEKSLIKEGVQMFGPNWTAIRMTYLPARTPDQLMQWWNAQRKDNIDEEYDDIERKHFWSEEEDTALKFAVSTYKNEQGEVSSWPQIAKMIHGRTPKQCRKRWMYTLKPDVTKGAWSYEEEMQLLEIVQKVKLQKSKTSKKSMWPLIAKELNTGRSDLACRSKYDYMQRKGHRFAF
ncbi:hypothetical protein INT48_002413 [Thamnidium elegans]|uniref:Uncharacterized protein n=1 Tax=Thamnidium elegans TaxID=101142 RepID=A0A8H7VXJ5_9FUNG|nr:hypothetical protein INT48_002413 [Thamnidium elegans]